MSRTSSAFTGKAYGVAMSVGYGKHLVPLCIGAANPVALNLAGEGHRVSTRILSLWDTYGAPSQRVLSQVKATVKMGPHCEIRASERRRIAPSGLCATTACRHPNDSAGNMVPKRTTARSRRLAWTRCGARI